MMQLFLFVLTMYSIAATVACIKYYLQLKDQLSETKLWEGRFNELLRIVYNKDKSIKQNEQASTPHNNI
jgi:hypothetical protein